MQMLPEGRTHGRARHRATYAMPPLSRKIAARRDPHSARSVPPFLVVEDEKVGPRDDGGHLASDGNVSSCQLTQSRAHEPQSACGRCPDVCTHWMCELRRSDRRLRSDRRSDRRDNLSCSPGRSSRSSLRKGTTCGTFHARESKDEMNGGYKPRLKRGDHEGRVGLERHALLEVVTDG